MKITQKQLQQLVQEELSKTVQEAGFNEGAMDYLKGAGQSVGQKVGDTGKAVAKSVGDKAKAVGNKMSQVAGDIKNAGATSSLKADLAKISQETTDLMKQILKKHQDLLARAQALRLNDEEEQLKTKLGALNSFFQASAMKSSDADKTVAPANVQSPKTATTSPPPELEPQEPKAQSGREIPKSVDLGSGVNEPFDWKAEKKPKITKDLIQKTYKSLNSNPVATAKKLGISLDDIRKIMKGSPKKPSVPRQMKQPASVGP